MKKIIALILTAVCLLSLVACATSSGETQNTTEPASKENTETASPNTAESTANEDVPVVKIGQITNLTGSGAQGGSWHQIAAQVFCDYINENGGIKSLGGAKLEIVVADGQSDSTQIKTATQRLLEDDEICAVMSNDGSNYTVALCPLFEKYEVPCVTMNYANAVTESG